MRLKTILASTATLLTLLTTTAVKARAQTSTTTATSAATTTATTTKTVTLHHQSAAESTSTPAPADDETTASTSSSATTMSSSATSNSSASSTNAIADSASTTDATSASSASASSTSASAPATSTAPTSSQPTTSPAAKVAATDTTVKATTKQSPTTRAVTQQRAHVQVQAKSTQAMQANTQTTTRMYNAVITSQKDALANGTLLFATFKAALAKATVPVTGIGTNDAVAITDTSNQSYPVGSTLYQFVTYKVVYDWSVADDVAINNGDTATVTMPAHAVLTGGTFNLIDKLTGVIVGSASSVSGATTATITFNDYYAENTLDSRNGNLTFYVSGDTASGSGSSSFAINKVGWINDDNELYWNIVLNSDGDTWQNVSLVDNLGLYQTFNPTSLVVESQIPDATTGQTVNTPIPAADYTATFDGNELTLTFKQPITYSIYMYYTAAFETNHVYANNATVTYTPVTATEPAVPHTVNVTGDVAQGGSGAVTSVVYSATVTKTDTATKLPVVNAVYSLYASDGTTLLRSDLTTNTNGQFTLTNLTSGSYVLRETKAPAGYLLDQNPQPFVVSAETATEANTAGVPNLMVPVAISDTAITPTTLTVIKQWQAVPTGQATPAITVTLYANGQATAQTLQLSTANQYQGTFTNLMSTDALGNAIVYTVVETVPTGYVSTQTTTGQQVTLINTYQLGTITIHKTASDTSAALANATFGLLDQAGQTVATGTTDQAGQLVFTGLAQGTYTVRELTAPAGYQLAADQTVTLNAEHGYTQTLTIVDVAIKLTTITVNKHWANVQPNAVTPAVTITLAANGRVIEVLTLNTANGYTGQFKNLAVTDATGNVINYTVSETPIAGYTVSGGEVVNGIADFTNTLQTSQLTVHKIDAQTQASLSGATFELLYNGQRIQTGVTDAQGHWQLTGLTAGTYTLREVSAPAGYQLAADQTVVIDPAVNVTTDVTVADTAIPVVVPPTTTVTVHKHWAQVPEMVTTPSVTVTLYANGQSTGQTVVLTAASGYTGQFTGLATSANDQALTYTVVETPIAGYTVTGGEVVDGVANLTNTWQDEPVVPTPTGSVQVIKVDATTNQVLAGAVFDLRDAAGQLIATGTTNALGQVTFSQLAYGTYQLSETKAPAGYELQTTPQSLVITTSTMQVVTVKNQAVVVPPVKPIDPVTPEVPTDPEQPMLPEVPVAPEQPTKPTTPTKPTVPTPPSQPGEPDQVAVQLQPNQPDQETFGEYTARIMPTKPTAVATRVTPVQLQVQPVVVLPLPTQHLTPKQASKPKVQATGQVLPQTDEHSALGLRLLGLSLLLVVSLGYGYLKRFD